MSRDYNFWIYIVTNRNQSVPYIGVTNSLSRRTWEHREGTRTGFASDYRCKKLIYYEHYRDIRDALARESQLKKWSRAKKIALNVERDRKDEAALRRLGFRFLRLWEHEIREDPAGCVARIRTLLGKSFA